MSIEASVHHSALNLAGKSNICVYFIRGVGLIKTEQLWSSDFWIREALSTVLRRWLWWHVSFSQWAVESVGSLEWLLQVLRRRLGEKDEDLPGRGHDRAALRRDRRGSAEMQWAALSWWVRSECPREIRWALKKKRWKILPLVKDNASSVKVLLLINGDSLLSLMYEVSSVSVS